MPTRTKLMPSADARTELFIGRGSLPSLLGQVASSLVPRNGRVPFWLLLYRPISPARAPTDNADSDRWVSAHLPFQALFWLPARDFPAVAPYRVHSRHHCSLDPE